MASEIALIIQSNRNSTSHSDGSICSTGLLPCHSPDGRNEEYHDLYQSKMKVSCCVAAFHLETDLNEAAFSSYAAIAEIRRSVGLTPTGEKRDLEHIRNIWTVESVDALCALRNRIARIEGQRAQDAAVHVPLGVDSLDHALGGGLARGRLHELFAAEPADAPSAAGFAAMLARLALPPTAPLLWLRQEDAERGGRLSAPGLAQIGLDPARLVLLVLRDPVMLLRAAADVVRCRPVGAAVIEVWKQPRALDLTASRRLAVAAEESGVTALMLRVDAEPLPSAAHTRWQIAPAPSAALEANAPGHPAFEIGLLRQRGRPGGGRWHVAWDREQARFAEAALPGAMVPAAAGGSAPARARA
jgi:protein ImuA